MERRLHIADATRGPHAAPLCAGTATTTHIPSRACWECQNGSGTDACAQQRTHFLASNYNTGPCARTSCLPFPRQYHTSKQNITATRAQTNLQHPQTAHRGTHDMWGLVEGGWHGPMAQMAAAACLTSTLQPPTRQLQGTTDPPGMMCDTMLCQHGRACRNKNLGTRTDLRAAPTIPLQLPACSPTAHPTPDLPPLRSRVCTTARVQRQPPIHGWRP